MVGEDHLAISLQENQSRRRVVVTEHSKELSWLFEQLRDLFRGRMDYISKYDFFGTLVQAALDYQKLGNDQAGLLLGVITAARAFAQ